MLGLQQFQRLQITELLLDLLIAYDLISENNAKKFFNFEILNKALIFKENICKFVLTFKFEWRIISFVVSDDQK